MSTHYSAVKLSLSDDIMTEFLRSLSAGRSVKWFSGSEFTCNGMGCCDKSQKVDHKLVEMLDLAREISKCSYVVNSGYRCPIYNRQVNGTDDSSHIKGLAADIKVAGNYERLKIVRGLMLAGFTRLGIYETFIHVDIDPEKPECIWLK